VSRTRAEISFCEQELAWCSAQLRDLPRLTGQKGAGKGGADMAEIQAKALSVEETYLKTLQRTLAECQAKLQEVVD
jgi:chromosome condensin MukBEF complex kleisin-like MukF subunit